ncbi:macro domain-containing protein [Halocatena marina]|uniref:Macro domain-containing protein n=1 Tax=Halocatena marina TaxID=2934937 RepID=A0ABD5YNZ3_9EURY|nr:macro domain-containing protein [Halocatena marina]
MEFGIIQGDIARQDVDAVVNAANTGLRMGSGVAGALRKGGGAPLNEEAISNGPIELGGAVETGGYNLPCEYVIHAAAMPEGGQASADSIRDATRNSLVLADDLGCESLVVPAIGCGVAGFDLRAGLEIICGIINEHDPESLSDVRVIAYGDEAFELLSDIARDE